MGLAIGQGTRGRVSLVDCYHYPCSKVKGGAVGWTPFSGGPSGRVSQSDQTSGCALCSARTTDYTPLFYKVTSQSSQLGVQGAERGWCPVVFCSRVGLETVLCFQADCCLAPWSSEATGCALQMGRLPGYVGLQARFMS